MKTLSKIFVGLAALVLWAVPVKAWFITGEVSCPNGTVFKNVAISITGNSVCEGAFSRIIVTDGEGVYFTWMPDCDGTYTVSIDVGTLPAGATVTAPPGGSKTVSLTAASTDAVVDFVIDGSVCAGRCWFTGGGAKIDPIANIPVGHKGKWISFGGNVNPGCSPTAGDGGNWNHIDRLANLHFQGRTIRVVQCGNVTPPPPPGSTSPKTPFNFIEWVGEGTVKGIQGNKVDLNVYFSARTEDRNEPGTKDSNAGSLIDRYYLHVYTNPANPAGSTVLVVNGDATNPLNVQPVEIDDGNFQLHISSCDNPPVF